MKIKHLSDTDIQQYVLDRPNRDNPNAVHIASCNDCRAKAVNYQLLFSGIQQQTKPVFNFNLTELVMAQLAAPKPVFSRGIFMVYLLALSIIALMVISCYSIKGYFSSLFTGFSTMAFYLAAIAAVSILIFQSREIYRKYEQQMASLNSY